ncbi:MAG: hypothetical protein EP343_15785 [Deltaproteobacteria bacterium]|nr:MAG: hypothetical protein EP343_15785 [Deltaproteobacteria bacterium]
MFMETLVIAMHELRISLTSKRVLFAAGIIILGAALITTTALNVAKDNQVQMITSFGQMHMKAGDKRKMQKALKAFMGRKGDIVEYRMEKPLLLSFVFFMVLLFFPFVVAILAYDAIADEIRGGAVRFLLSRARRASLLLGKYMAHGILLLALLTLGYLSVLVSGLYALQGSMGAWLRETSSLIILSWIMTLGYLGWVLFASSMVKKPFLALMLSIAGLLVMGIVGLTRFHAYSPNFYKIDLLGPPTMAYQSAGIFLGFAALMLFCAGGLLQWRDL